MSALAAVGRRRALWIAVAVAVVVVVGLLVWSGRPAGSPEAGEGTEQTSAPITSPSADDASPSPGSDVSPSPSSEAPPSTTGEPAQQPSSPPPPVEPDPPQGDATEPSTGAPPFGDPVPSDVGAPVDVTQGVTVTVSDLQAVDGAAAAPGEISGPSVGFTVRVTNSTTEEVSLVSAVVNAYFGASATPGIQLTSAGSPLPSSVAPGAQAEGTYVFLLPEDRDTVRVEVFSVPGAGVVVAEGATPGS